MKNNPSEIGALSSSGGTLQTKVNGNGKDMTLGTGGGDVYLHNSNGEIHTGNLKIMVIWDS